MNPSEQTESIVRSASRVVGVTSHSLLWISLAVFLAASCKKESKVQAVAKASSAPAALPPGGDLMGQLAAEAAARPPNTTTVERIVEALGQQGIALGAFQQSIGRTHGAAYCANVRTPDLYVFICEYPDLARLEAGRALTEQIFKQVPDHSYSTSQSTSVLVQALTAAGKAQAASVSTIVTAMH